MHFLLLSQSKDSILFGVLVPACSTIFCTGRTWTGMHQGQRGICANQYTEDMNFIYHLVCTSLYVPTVYLLNLHPLNSSITKKKLPLLYQLTFKWIFLICDFLWGYCNGLDWNEHIMFHNSYGHKNTVHLISRYNLVLSYILYFLIEGTVGASTLILEVKKLSTSD
jgi:hypothetical protein